MESQVSLLLVCVIPEWRAVVPHQRRATLGDDGRKRYGSLAFSSL